MVGLSHLPSCLSKRGHSLSVDSAISLLGTSQERRALKIVPGRVSIGLATSLSLSWSRPLWISAYPSGMLPALLFVDAVFFSLVVIIRCLKGAWTGKCCRPLSMTVFIPCDTCCLWLCSHDPGISEITQGTDMVGLTGFLGQTNLPRGHPQELPCGSAGKESACNAGDLSSVPGLGRSPTHSSILAWRIPRIE